MTRLHLLLRNLRYFRAANIAVIAGVVVATAVLTGALLVGDSVRGSLRQIALDRLGPIDAALVAPRFFDQSLADRIRAVAETDVVPALLVRGGASDDELAAAIAGIWTVRQDRYSELRTAETVDLPKVEMSFIGG